MNIMWVCFDLFVFDGNDEVMFIYDRIILSGNDFI